MLTLAGRQALKNISSGMKIDFSINGKAVSVDVDPTMPLLWVVRDILRLKATKYGCGRAICGACTLHIDGEAQRSCSTPVRYASGKTVITLEGLSTNTEQLHPVQQAWLEAQVPQCGYCQPGFMMAAARFIESHPDPSVEDIKDNITNICRCGTQPRIIEAIKRAAELRWRTGAA
jgi:isoquinoline 1-oxidoreductase alpha subunit